MRGEEGRSIREIADLLSVSRCSVSLWVRDVPLSEEQISRLIARNPALNASLRGTPVRARLEREKRLAAQADGRRLARSSPGFSNLCMLHWAEGSKSRNSVLFTNSDPDMLRVVVRALRETFNLDDEAFSVYCNLFADHLDHQRDIECFWLEALALPASCLRKSTVNHYSPSSGRKRMRTLPHGTCRVAVHNTRIMQAIYGGIQEIGGFERPEWLDC